MATFHKGTELNNVKETWNENERNPERGVQPEPARSTSADDLQQTISREAESYDRRNKEDKLLGGDRATLNDE
ncbi:MAG: hypothetical protein EOO08_08865 [Chitinophagaceae bacterium]|nr:MAG: hypothetical protein EOO08_08865 [Chitinophagaceae bacterium]